MGAPGKATVLAGTILLVMISGPRGAWAALLFPLMVMAVYQPTLLPKVFDRRLFSTGLVLGALLPVASLAGVEPEIPLVSFFVRLAALSVSVGFAQKSISIDELSRLGGGRMGFVLGVALSTVAVVHRVFRSMWMTLRCRASWKGLLVRPSLVLWALSSFLARMLSHADQVTLAAEMKGYPRSGGADCSFGSGDKLVVFLLAWALGVVVGLDVIW